MTVNEFILVKLIEYGFSIAKATEALAAIFAEGGHLAVKWADPIDWCPAMTKALAVKAVERHVF